MSLDISKTSKYSLSYTAKDNSIPLINESICELQASLAQYFTVAATKHMVLKDSLNSSKAKKIETNFIDLEKFLNESLEFALEISHKYVKKYFNGRLKFSPRVTIKAPYENGLIIDLYRKDKAPFEMFEVNENTAFKYIKDTGGYYFCNDIPRAVSEEKYENKRINSQAVRSSYKLPGGIVSAYRGIVGQPEVDPVWESFWYPSDSDNRPHTESCYKSTLVVPMTLINATLRRDFKEYIFDNSDVPERDDKHEKLMFGFLCIDHRHINFFNRGSDVRVGYIIADILSLFLIVRMMYTTKSRTYLKAVELITKGKK